MSEAKIASCRWAAALLAALALLLMPFVAEARAGAGCRLSGGSLSLAGPADVALAFPDTPLTLRLSYVFTVPAEDKQACASVFIGSAMVSGTADDGRVAGGGCYFADLMAPIAADFEERGTLSLTLSATCSMLWTPPEGARSARVWASVTATLQSGEGVTATAPVLVLQPKPERTALQFRRASYSLAFNERLDLAAEIGAAEGVSFAADDEVCRIIGGMLTALRGSGGCRVTAARAGEPVETATAEIRLTPAEQGRLSLSASGMLSYPGSVTLSASGGAGNGLVSFAVVSGPCTVAGDVLTSTANGTCGVIATKAADGDHSAVTSARLDIVAGGGQAAGLAGDAVRRSLETRARSMMGYVPTTRRLDMRRSSSGSYGIVVPQGNSAEGTLNVSTSMQQMAEASGKSDRLASIVPAAVSRPGEGYDPFPRGAGTFDLWLDGRYAWSNGADNDGGLDQRVFLGEAGVDYLVTESLLVGFSARLDTNDATVGGEGGSLDTKGWMVGPYAVYEIVSGLQVDGKLAYGQSGNDISLRQDRERYDGHFDTTRWLAEAGVRGTLEEGSFVIEPGIRAAWYRETAERYSLGNGGGRVDGADLTILRVALDPRFTYAHVTGGGTMFGPFLRPQLVAERQDVSGDQACWDVYGVVEGGISIATESFVLTGSMEASGLGGDGDMLYSAGANLTIPLN